MRNLKDLPDQLTIAQLLKYLSLKSKKTLIRWEKKGSLMPLRVGLRRDRLYRKKDIEKFLKDRSEIT